MALSFPLAFDRFSDQLKVNSFSWVLETYHEISGLPQGHMLTNEVAEPRWRADVELAPMLITDAHPILATLQMLSFYGSDGTFYLSDPSKPGGLRDPTGATTASASMFINQFNSRRGFSTRGLPPTHQITRGDMLQVSDGTRNALFRSAETVSTSGAGISNLMDVIPYLKAFVALNNKVTLWKPAAKMILIPGSLNTGKAGLKTIDGISFSAIEVI